MSTIYGDNGKVATGTLKTLNFTYATPRENLLGSPLTLPTTEPASPQVSYTIQQSDLPTISPPPRSFKLVASVITAGKFITSGSVSYRVLKNGASVATATLSSTPANQFYTITHWRFFDVQVGDVLEIKLWSSVADSNFDYSALYVLPTQPFLSHPSVVLKDLTIVNGQPPSLTLGSTPTITNTSSLGFYPVNSSTTSFGIAVGTHNMSFHYHTVSGLYKLINGDATLTSSITNHATQRPAYQKSSSPTSITFRELYY